MSGRSLAPDPGSVLLRHPGQEVDLSVSTSLRTLTQVFLGQVGPEAAVRSGDILLEGTRALVRTFPRWCPRSRFAEHAHVPEGARSHRPRAM